MTDPTPQPDTVAEPAETEPCEVCGKDSAGTVMYKVNVLDPPADAATTATKVRVVPICGDHLDEYQRLGGQDFFHKHLSKTG